MKLLHSDSESYIVTELHRYIAGSLVDWLRELPGVLRVHVVSSLLGGGSFTRGRVTTFENSIQIDTLEISSSGALLITRQRRIDRLERIFFVGLNRGILLRTASGHSCTGFNLDDFYGCCCLVWRSLQSDGGHLQR